MAHAGPGPRPAGARRQRRLRRRGDQPAAPRPGFRVDTDEAAEPLGARVRRAKLEKLPYVLVVGDEDERAGSVGVNARGTDPVERGWSLEAFLARLAGEVAGRGRPEDGAP